MIERTDRFSLEISDDNKSDPTLHYRIHYRKIIEVNPCPLYFLETLTWLALHKMLS